MLEGVQMFPSLNRATYTTLWVIRQRIRNKFNTFTGWGGSLSDLFYMFRQMQKLIELLNKHRREKVKKQSWITEWHYNAFTFSLDNIRWQQAELLIISKQYWFIKWLVENEKIDLDKLEKKVLKENLIRKFDEWLLMLLSIQDEPIEFLISILK